MIIKKTSLITLFLFFFVCAYCADVKTEIEKAVENAAAAAENFKWRQLNGTLYETENLVFGVYWKFIKVGEATLEIKGVEEINGRPAYHLYSQARSSSFFDNFFKVRDVNESWMDKESLCSVGYNFDVSEGGWKKREYAYFDQIRKEFFLNDNANVQKGKITPWVQDIISAFYYFRTVELEYGDEYVFDVHSGDKTWPLKTKVSGREKIEVKAGTFDCLILEPAVRENAGIFQAKGKLKVWLTNDGRKMPVMMKTKTPFGSVKCELSSYSRPDAKNAESAESGKQKKEAAYEQKN